MILLKIPPVILFLLFVQIVTCDDLADKSVPLPYGSRLSRQSYRFNHPPSAEEGKIPDFEDIATKDEKLLKVNINKTSPVLSSTEKESFHFNFTENSKPIIQGILSEFNSNQKNDRIKSRTEDNTLIEKSNQPKKTNSRIRGERARYQNKNNFSAKIDENENANIKGGDKLAETVKENRNQKFSSDTSIPVQVVYEEPAITRGRVSNQRKRIDSEKVSGFRRQKDSEKYANSVDSRSKFQSIQSDDKNSITTYHPPSASVSLAKTTILPIQTENLSDIKTEVTSAKGITNRNELNIKRGESLKNKPNLDANGEELVGTVQESIEKIKPKLSSETFIPVKIVYEEQPVTRSKGNQRKQVDSDRVRGFTLQKVDEKTNDAESTRTKQQTDSTHDKVSFTPYNTNLPTIQTSTVKTASNQSDTTTNVETDITPSKSIISNLESDPKDEQSSVDTSNLETTIANVSKTIGKRKRQRDPVVPIVESTNNIYSQSGSFKYSYEGGDGTKAYSQGELKTFDNNKAGEAVVGGFSYKDKEGKDFSLTYTADENGYRPVGDHLPTSPPIPVAIARALRYLATKTTPEPVTKAVTSETSTFETGTQSSENTTSVIPKSTVNFDPTISTKSIAKIK